MGGCTHGMLCGGLTCPGTAYPPSSPLSHHSPALLVPNAQGRVKRWHHGGLSARLAVQLLRLVAPQPFVDKATRQCRIVAPARPAVVRQEAQAPYCWKFGSLWNFVGRMQEIVNMLFWDVVL
jgi:hypothetical protein